MSSANDAGMRLSSPALGTLVVGACMVVAIAVFAGAGIFAESLATGHAQLHAATAVGVLLVAGAIIRIRPSPGLASRALVVGLVLVAGAQLLESFGAFGYAADNDTRVNGLALLHDLGLTAGPIALLAMVVATAIAVGGSVPRLGGGRVVSGLVALAIVIAGVLGVRTLVGL